MNVFSLRSQLIADYSQFARSFTSIRAQDIKDELDLAYADGRYWPEPLIQINPRYRQGRSTKQLAATNELLGATANLFPIDLYTHQEQAIAFSAKGESYIVTTGTGSGKSLCFFIPIVDAILRAKVQDSTPKTRAIVIYPMNALANSQLEELIKFIGKGGPVTFARYTGQERGEDRKKVKDNPPDILLTNFMMLEMLMTRQDEIDSQVMDNCSGLQFLVLDELHTYRGRQGADVAMLVRRVRERLAPERLQCIGTSATMASGGIQEDRNRKVADVASTLFATDISPFNVITENLERATDPTATAESVKPLLGTAIDAGIPAQASDEELRAHPLAIWVETRLGVTRESGGKWARANPLTLDDATKLLAVESGRDEPIAGEALQALLLLAARPEKERRSDGLGSDKAFFAFRLHQFISGAGVVYTTLDAPGSRPVELEGQQFLPDDDTKRLYAAHFCRTCGQEYHPVRIRREEGRWQMLPRDIDDMPLAARGGEDTDEAEEDASGEQVGFLTPTNPEDPLGFTGLLEDYPETWIETTRRGEYRLKRNTARYLHEHLNNKFRGVAVEAVTGEFPAEERERRVEELGEAERRLLIATDCLSEGINLQQHLDAIVHYDLSWNPTRHEQRKGRVDRFGQPSPRVRATLIYGANNPVDGAVLQVILRKAEKIRQELGVSVPLPDDDHTLTQALMKAVMLHSHQAPVTGDLFEQFEASQVLDVRWTDLAEKAKKNRTVFAQRRLRPAEVLPEWERMRTVLGSGDDVKRFTAQAMARLGAGLDFHARGATAPVSALPELLRERLIAEGIDGDLRIDFSQPPAPRCRFIHRSHPLIATLAGELLERALTTEDHDGQQLATLGRVGVWRSSAVQSITSILLLRLRHQIATIRSDHSQTLLVEEALPVAWQGRTEPTEVQGEQLLTWLEAPAQGNLPESVRQREIHNLLTSLQERRPLFEEITASKRLVAVYSFENEEFVFPAVHHAMKFSLVILGGLKAGAESASFINFARQIGYLFDLRRQYTLTPEEFVLINPNTRTCPVFRSNRDAELTKKLYRQAPVLIREALVDEDGNIMEQEANPWGIRFQAMLHMANDSHLFRDSTAPGRLPLYEAKMIHQFDHRWASYLGSKDGVATVDVTQAQKAEPDFTLHPRYWVEEREVLARIARVPRTLTKAWLALHKASDRDEQRSAVDALWLALAQWIAGELFRREVGSPQTDSSYGDKQKLQTTPRVERALASDYPACAAALREAKVSGKKAFIEFAKWAQQDSEVPLSDDELATLQTFAAQATGETRDLALHAELDTWMDRRSPRWLMGWRDITNATNERTVIASVIPRAGVGHTMPLWISPESPRKQAALLGCLNSLALDYVARQKVGGTHLTYGYIKQFPVLPPDRYSDAELDFIVPRVLELTYTANDLADWAADLGYTGEPFPWNSERCARLRSELDEYYARLYGLTEEELRYILDPADVAGDDYPSETFRVLKNNEIKEFDKYRTQRLVLEAWKAQHAERVPHRPVPAHPLEIPRRAAPYLQYLPDTVPCCEEEDWLAGLVCDLVIQGGPLSEQDLRMALVTEVAAGEHAASLAQLRSKIAALERRPADLLAHVKHQLANALGVEESSPFRKASLFDESSLHGLAEQQITKCTTELRQLQEQSDTLEQERLAILEQRAPLHYVNRPNVLIRGRETWYRMWGRVENLLFQRCSQLPKRNASSIEAPASARRCLISLLPLGCMTWE